MLAGRLKLILPVAALLATAAADRTPAELPTWLIGRWCFAPFEPPPPVSPPAPCDRTKAPCITDMRLFDQWDPDQELGGGCLYWSSIAGPMLQGSRLTRYSGRNASVEYQRIWSGQQRLLYSEDEDQGFQFPRRRVVTARLSEAARGPGMIVFARGDGTSSGYRVTYRRTGDILDIERRGRGERTVERFWLWPDPPARSEP